jgi:MraZ protein
MHFLGTYEYAMDERGRVPMPPRFRDALRDGVILTQGAPDRCIRGFSTSAFDEQAGLYTAEPAIHRDGRILRRQFFARAHPVELDRQGRVLIPGVLRKFADLTDQVVVIGAGEGFEIWATSFFDEVMRTEEEDYARALESVEGK